LSARIAIIGGTGLDSLPGLAITGRQVINTPWGEPSGPITHGVLGDCAVAFLARHGYAHNIPPHRVNYRANLWALREIGIVRVVAVAAVGGIHPGLRPGTLAVPHQIIDYTWGRGHTFFEDELTHVVHVDFTRPYSEALRQALLAAGRAAGTEIRDGGIYAAAQGPRLETAAEIDRLERDGCDQVGMTGMPEAALAREAELDYAHLTVVANAAAGRGEGPISMQAMEASLKQGMERVRRVLGEVVGRC
jgi:5'-methylthioinosine phosphorylase